MYPNLGSSYFPKKALPQASKYPLMNKLFTKLLEIQQKTREDKFQQNRENGPSRNQKINGYESEREEQNCIQIGKASKAFEQCKQTQYSYQYQSPINKKIQQYIKRAVSALRVKQEQKQQDKFQNFSSKNSYSNPNISGKLLQFPTNLEEKPIYNLPRRQLPKRNCNLQENKRKISVIANAATPTKISQRHKDICQQHLIVQANRPYDRRKSIEENIKNLNGIDKVKTQFVGGKILYKINGVYLPKSSILKINPDWFRILYERYL